MNGEKFSIAKTAKSFIDPLSWWKSAMSGSKIVVLVVALWSGYISFVKPHFNPLKTHTYKAENLTVINKADDKFFIGVKVFGFKLGVSK